MRTSVILVTDSLRGLDVLTNGLLGQVRQVATRKITKKRVDPVFKRFEEFELLVVNYGSVGSLEAEAEKARELTMARGLAKDARLRKEFNLTQFELRYANVPGSRWEAFRYAIREARGQQLVFMPDYSYPGTRFLEAMTTKQASVPSILLHHYQNNVDPTHSDLLGILLDPECEITHEPAESADPSVYPLRALAIDRFSLDPMTGRAPPPVGWELNTLLATSFLKQYNRIINIEATLPALDPTQFGAAPITNGAEWLIYAESLAFPEPDKPSFWFAKLFSTLKAP